MERDERMEKIQDFVMARPLLPDEPLKDAVYCAECEVFQQEIIGSKIGDCMGHEIPDSSTPMMCKYFKDAQSIVSVLVFLKSGISIYHKAIVKDAAKEIEPNLLTSFLQAINDFGGELIGESITSIEFQKMNIFFSKGKYTNGAMILKGKISEDVKSCFTEFMQNVEGSFLDYFNGPYTGRCLPEEDVDQIAFKTMKQFAHKKLYTITPSVIEKSCNLKCGVCSK